MNPIDSKFFKKINANFDQDALLYASNEQLYAYLFEKLLSICANLEGQAKHYNESNEDLISGSVSLVLNQTIIFQAANETFCNGKVDITITALTIKDKSNFACLGEAKIWGGPSYALTGVEQLERYLTGRHNQAFMIYYFKDGNCDGKFSEYINSLMVNGIAEEIMMLEPRRAITRHTHSSGAKIDISHFVVNLYYAQKNI